MHSRGQARRVPVSANFTNTTSTGSHRSTPTCSASTSATVASRKTDEGCTGFASLWTCATRASSLHAETPWRWSSRPARHRCSSDVMGSASRSTRTRSTGLACCRSTGPGRSTCASSRSPTGNAGSAISTPELLLRGVIHSDGCRVINRVWGGGKRYAYPRYEFSNRSAEIRRIFCDYCDALGIAWRQMKPTDISVARREAVAKLDAFVGPKR